MTVPTTIPQQPQPDPFNTRARVLMEDAQEIVTAGSAREVAARIDGIDLDDELAVLREAFGAAQARLADILAIADEAGRAACYVAQEAAEVGRDWTMADVATVILRQQEDGTSDGEIVSAVLAMVDLRVSLGCVDAVEALTGSDL